MRCRVKVLSLLLCFVLVASSSTCTSQIVGEGALQSQPALAVEPLSLAAEVAPGPVQTNTHQLPQIPEPRPVIEHEQEPEPEPDPWPIIYNARLAVVGDLMAHESQIESTYDNTTKSYSFSSWYEQIMPYLTDADYTIGNLETTLSGEQAVYTGYPVFNSPDEYAVALKEAGFDMLTTANNHSYDRGEAGVLRTLEVLDALGIDHVGTYASQEDQERTFIKEINGISFAFLSYTYSTNGIPLARGKPYLVNMLDEELMRLQIEQARSDGAEIIVVMPHMGNEYEETPAYNYVNLARRLCQYGADVIMASHPHVLQPTEVFEVEDDDGSVRTCFIAYSMGNFVSGQRNIPCDVGAVFYLDFEKIVDEHGSSVRITQASFAPTWVLFRNPSWEIDIKVLPVSDTLKAVDAGEDLGIGIWDIARMRDVHRQTTRKMLGEEVPESEMKPVYTLYKALS